MYKTVTARLADVSKMRFDATTPSGHTVPMDALPKVGGEDSAVRPAELVLVGLSGCTGMDVISILRKMRQSVTRFDVAVESVKAREEYPQVWQELRVTFTVDGEVDPERLARAIDLSRTRYCRVSSALTATVHYRYVLNGETVDLPDKRAELD